MIETLRLILRQWRDTDYLPFAEMSANPEVMRHFPKVLTRAESDVFLDKLKAIIEKQGWGFWAVELKQTQQLIGLVGLHDQPTQFSFSPCVEIGWRLDQAFWGKGYAKEAANAALDFAFNHLQLETVVSFTTLENLRSEALMQSLGMRKLAEFQHPALAQDHPLSWHVLYEIQQSARIK
ncbi:GNAT family N-acetyltransferase [Acinetobacter junii]|uniref:GNAT family N-acetyltransferase n=1 Tax=Acinetobacter junii TaxID=40215 RepID=UPI0010A9EF76|nr:GNAT family N-acetyltransferase [Acinetobacter junii]MCU4406167.1 GNAT family N-acetyltransferase [Acinetobacter junii]TID68986.1 GNAT family N-acetyltransferase [Acinetobacter junii]